jgi:DNA-binding PadR family transcriptional regulator
MKLLSRKEELLLLTIMKLGDNAYGVTIREQVSAATRKYWSIGAVYDVLDRLNRKGYVSTSVGEPIAERGGKSRRFYQITPRGYKGLEEIRELQEFMWTDLPKPAFKGE